MIIVKLWGGMCNQMFQYAFGYALARTVEDTLLFDVDFYENQPKYVGKRTIVGKEDFPELTFETIKRTRVIKFFENKYISHLIRYNTGCDVTLGNIHIMIECLHKHYNEIPYEKNKANFYDGYWTTSRYFEKYEADIRHLFSPTKNVKIAVSKWRESIKSEQCVAVHVRRGDYLNKKNSEGLCDANYYFKAIEYAKGKIKNPTFCFFSDDINWCKTTFSSLVEASVFVENKGSDAALKDLYSIATCEYGIMSSSTFSWWGNWLRSPEKKSFVIYPRGNYHEKFITDSRWVEL